MKTLTTKPEKLPAHPRLQVDAPHLGPFSFMLSLVDHDSPRSYLVEWVLKALVRHLVSVKLAGRK